MIFYAIYGRVPRCYFPLISRFSIQNAFKRCRMVPYQKFIVDGGSPCDCRVPIIVTFKRSDPLLDKKQGHSKRSTKAPNSLESETADRDREMFLYLSLIRSPSITYAYMLRLLPTLNARLYR